MADMKKILATAVLMAGMTAVMDAQTVISNETMTQDGTNVTVSFDVDTDQTDIPSKRKEVILPYIYNGKDTLFLDVVEVYGKGRFKRERQENAINGDRTWELTGNQILKNEGVYSYRSEIPLKRWMTSANLGIRRQLVGCACEGDMSDENLAEGVALFEEPQVQRRTPEYALTEATGCWDFGQDELEVIFKVSKVDIDHTIFNNQATFTKLLAAVDKIFENPKYKLDKIVVSGYASPEGPAAFNNWLGENRAKALINYVIGQRPQYGLTMDHFTVINGDENWAGMKELLADSDIDKKDEVIKIIDDSSLSNAGKKATLKAMDGGKVWKEMLEKIYPYLRCTRYQAVYYESTIDKATEVINMANELIRAGKYTQAQKEVETVMEDGRSYNTLGVALMMQKRFEEALPWFSKALEAGNAAAQKNIDAVNAELEWEKQQRNEIQEYLKKYE
jgi:hypothetical protein